MVPVVGVEGGTIRSLELTLSLCGLFHVADTDHRMRCDINSVCVCGGGEVYL